MSRRGAVLLVALVAAILLGACGGGSDDASSGSPLLAMLRAVPDTDDAAQYVSYSDLDKQREHATEDRVPAGFVRSGFFHSADRDAIQQELGFDIDDVSQTLEAGSPPAIYDILRGDFDADAIETAVQGDEVWGDLLEEKSYGGVSYYSWGEADFEQHLDRVTAVNRIGQSHRLALSGGLLLWCLWTDGMEGMIDAIGGNQQSLADREDFGPMAQVIAAMDPYGAAFTMQTQDFPAPSGEPLLLPYTAIAIASAVDDTGSYLAVLLSHEDEASAAENVGRLQARIAEGTDADGSLWSQRIQSADVRAEGKITIGILRGQAPAFPWDFLVRGEPLLVHE